MLVLIFQPYRFLKLSKLLLPISLDPIDSWKISDLDKKPNHILMEFVTFARWRKLRLIEGLTLVLS